MNIVDGIYLFCVSQIVDEQLALLYSNPSIRKVKMQLKYSLLSVDCKCLFSYLLLFDFGNGNIRIKDDLTLGL